MTDERIERDSVGLAGIAPLRTGVAVIVLSSVAVFFVLGLSRPVGLVLQVAEQFAFLVPLWVSVGLTWRCRSVAADHERRFWGFLALSVTLISVSETIVSVETLVATPESWSPLMVVLTLGAAATFVTAMFITTRVHGAHWTLKTRYLADTLILGVLLFLGVLYAVIAPWYARAGLTLVDAALATVYFVAGFALVAGAAITARSLKVDRWRTWERIVAIGIAEYGIATMLSPFWHAAFAGGAPAYWLTVVTAMWSLGFAIVAIGAAYRLGTPSDAWRIVAFYPHKPTAHAWIPVLIDVPALLLMPVLVVSAREASSANSATVLTSGAVVLALVMAARFSALGIEHGLTSVRSRTDSLTGLSNYSTMHERLGLEVQRGLSTGQPLAIVAADIDGLKRMNAEKGHAGGDAFLRALGARLRQLIEPRHEVCRPSADEFVVILSDASVTQARAVAERVRAEVLALSLGHGVALTASCGIACFPAHGRTAETLLERADRAMRASKMRGRDCVTIFADDPSKEAPGEGLGNPLLARMATMRAVAVAVDARDSDTQNHSRNVAQLAVLLGRESGLDGERLSMLEAAALLHDVGKAGVPDSVLSRRGSLSPSDRALVRQHSELGERLLAATALGPAAGWIRGHHERWDGSGYPDGLAGEEIPLEARVLAICDAFDAMTSPRPYRGRMTLTAALQEIDLGMGTQFDPVLAEVFIRAVSRPEAVRFRSALGD